MRKTSWLDRAKTLRKDTLTVLLACRDRRTPWYAKALAAGIAAYALSPVDLIPDFIPVLGLLDDFILVPLGIMAVIKMIPEEVLADCRAKAADTLARPGRNWIAGAIVIAIWAVLVILIIRFIIRKIVL